MNLREKKWTFFPLALILCVTAAFGQDQKQGTTPVDPNAPLQPQNTNPDGGNQPIGAARGVSGQDNPQPYDPSQVTPDTNTLAGVTPFTLGSLQRKGNVFDPAITVSQLGQTFPSSTGASNLTGETIVGGSLNFDRIWSANRFTALYNGGENFNYGNSGASGPFGTSTPNYQFHDLSVTQEADLARWRIVLKDIFAASPGAMFTGQGIGGPGLSSQISSLLGSSLSSFAGSTVPSQTINTGFAMRYANSILGQVGYSFSRRSTLTISGSYGLLHFTGPGYISSNLVTAQAGYDYLLDPSNSIAFLASYGKIDYTGTTSSTTDYVGALAYGRKITGRLAFQVSAGPQIIRSTGGALGNFQQIFASVNSSLSYARRRSGVSFSYMRGLSGGSGVLEGATSNTFSGSAHHQFTRFWSGAISGGYALNTSLAPAGVAATQFNNWFAGANLGRQIGRHLQINFNYGAVMQDSPANCPVASCGVTGLQQTFGMTVNWHLLPVALNER
jgi:hypothetical protein